jgi:arginine transport system substrate-binding protein
MKKCLFGILFLVLSFVHANTLRVGTTLQNPPFSSLADKNGHFYGFDMNIMEEICKRIKVSCTFTPLVFSDLFTQMKAGKIDLAIAAIIINDFQEEDFLFSLPYLQSNGEFIALLSSPINKPSDIINKRVGVRRGTPFKNLALTMYKNQIEIVEAQDMGTLLGKLNDKDIDVALINAAAAKYWYANNSEIYKLIGTQIPTGEGYGIMANKGQEALIGQINQALLNMEADGSYLAIYTRYFGN